MVVGSDGCGRRWLVVGGRVEKMAMAQDVRTFHDLVVPVESEQSHRVSSVCSQFDAPVQREDHRADQGALETILLGMDIKLASNA